jgi:hypothetical protein
MENLREEHVLAIPVLTTADEGDILLIFPGYHGDLVEMRPLPKGCEGDEMMVGFKDRAKKQGLL